MAEGRDWTRSQFEACPDCGADASAVDDGELGAELIREVAEWGRFMAAADPLGVKERPSPDTWSALEYACHVRDVYELYDYRLSLMLEQDGPEYPNWDQDTTAVEKNYGAAEPAEVSVELVRAADQLADRFESVGDDQWARTGFRSDGAAFTVESFARYLIHDPVHHLWDVTGESQALVTI